MRLAVVGGGISGLAAAWEAANLGVDVVVLEASDRFGGKIRTERDRGRIVEHGPDSFVSYRPAAMALIDELGMSEQVISTSGTRKVQLRAGGRLHPLPDGMGMVLPTKLWPFISTGILTPWDKLRAGLDLVLPRQLGADDVAIGAFLGRRLGRGIVEKFADPLIGGVYGAGVDELSLDAILPALRRNEREHRSLLLASLAQGRAARASSGSPFRTLTGGLGTLVERLVDQLDARGVDLRTGTGVLAFETAGDGATRIVLGDGVLTADAVVLALGPADAARLLAPHVPEAADALAEIPLASTCVVTLAYDAQSFAAPVTSHGWLEDGRAPISGATISSAKWAGRVPDGEVLVRAFVPDRVGPAAQLPDDELLAQVRHHVESVLDARSAPASAWLTRWQGVMPKYTVGHPARAAAVTSALAGTSWRVAGSALHGVGVPDCVADARRQTRDLISTQGTLPTDLLGSPS